MGPQIKNFSFGLQQTEAARPLLISHVFSPNIHLVINVICVFRGVSAEGNTYLMTSATASLKLPLLTSPGIDWVLRRGITFPFTLSITRQKWWLERGGVCICVCWEGFCFSSCTCLFYSWGFSDSQDQKVQQHTTRLNYSCKKPTLYLFNYLSFNSWLVSHGPQSFILNLAFQFNTHLASSWSQISGVSVSCGSFSPQELNHFWVWWRRGAQEKWRESKEGWGGTMCTHLQKWKMTMSDRREGRRDLPADKLNNT